MGSAVTVDLGLGDNGLHLGHGGSSDDNPGLHLGNGDIGDNLGLHLGNSGKPGLPGKSKVIPRAAIALAIVGGTLLLQRAALVARLLERRRRDAARPPSCVTRSIPT